MIGQDLTYCMQGMHMVPKSKMSSLSLPKGLKRRMCESCKSDVMDRRAKEKLEGSKKCVP